MLEVEENKQASNRPARISYFFMVGVLVVGGWLHMATPLLAALFAYLALEKLHFFKGRRSARWLAVGLFLILLAGIAYGLGYFIRVAVRALPEIADQAIPSVIHWAQQYQIELPFTDYDSFKDSALDIVKSQANYLGNFAKLARGATAQVVFLVVGCVVAISIFLNPRMELHREAHGIRDNLYSLSSEAIAERFATFYRSFATVMGAQIVISAINTVFTTVFVTVMHLPYAVVVVGMTFLCGLLPVVGNLISNTVIVGIGFTVSPRMALLALIFLVVIHKLEYFLNSKIVGDRIDNPLWLTLLGLIIGERLMGVPGMILAPVVLHYLKLETARIAVHTDRNDTDS